MTAAAKAKKTTVIGRPTMGNTDYCNFINLTLDSAFTLTYPISKTKAAKEGHGISGKGVPVDIYIPWTPEECTHDVLLNRALDL